MFTSRFMLFAISLGLSSYAVVPSIANAQASYYTSTAADKNCFTCHSPSPVTCNGCHGHGTHGTSVKDSMNLVATADKTSYAPGDDISVTLTGGYKASGWVRVNVYDSKGVLLVSNKTDCPHNASSYAATCDLPVTLKTRAQAGMTNLYVAWMGNEYDEPNAIKGAPLTSVIGVGKRAASGGAPTGHVEEVVLTNTFVVAEAAAPAAGGGGSWDLLLSAFIALSFLRRRNESQ